VLAHEARVLMVAADHPLAGRAEVTTEDIADYEVSDIRGLVPDSIRDAVVPERAASGRPMKRRRLKHHQWSELTTMLARGKLVHPVTASLAEQFPAVCAGSRSPTCRPGRARSCGAGTTAARGCGRSPGRRGRPRRPPTKSARTRGSRVRFY
jgi:DNA-binding transcriptional LysR family regulator